MNFRVDAISCSYSGWNDAEIDIWQSYSGAGHVALTNDRSQDGFVILDALSGFDACPNPLEEHFLKQVLLP
jgi:hypothetical protein